MIYPYIVRSHDWAGGEETGEMKLHCPLCGHSYVHLESPHEHDDENTCPTGERGWWIDIPAWGECGHRFNLVLAFHKGETFLHAVAGRQSAVHTLPLSSGRRSALDKAVAQIENNAVNGGERAA